MLEPVLRAISEPHRRQILRLIHTRRFTAWEISAHFDAIRPAISQHFRVLAFSGLVNVCRKSTRLLYKAQLKGLERVNRYLDDFWAWGSGCSSSR